MLPQADDCIASLLGGTPEQFDVGFAEIIKKNAVRAMIVARYIVANLLPFPYDIVTEHLPALTGITHELAKKAGSPFAWAFIMMLPLFGLACASSRLWINELFLIPPVVWINLVLDSGANKSGILLAIGEIAGLFERHLLKVAEAELDAAHAQPNEQAMLLKKKAALREDPPNLTADDDDSMPATGVKMQQNGNRCIGIFDEGKNLYRALVGKTQTSWGAATLSRLFGGGDWKRNVLKDQNKFHMLRACLQFVTTIHIEEWDEFVERDESTGLQYRFMNLHSQPMLGRSDDVMDEHVYHHDQADEDRPGLPESVLEAFVEAMAAIDSANSKSCADYDPGTIDITTGRRSRYALDDQRSVQCLHLEYSS